jgi:hypothetical protein
MPALLIACGAAIVAVVTTASVFFVRTRDRSIRVPLAVQLPSCREGAFEPTKPPNDQLNDIFDKIVREQCERSKGLDGTASLSGGTLLVSLHNPSPFPITSARLRVEVTSSQAKELTREYELHGTVARFADGSLRAATNLDSRTVRTFRATLVSAWFEDMNASN